MHENYYKVLLRLLLEPFPIQLKKKKKASTKEKIKYTKVCDTKKKITGLIMRCLVKALKVFDLLLEVK